MTIEINSKFIKPQPPLSVGNSRVLVTPPIDKEYYLARIVLYKDQAIQLFPKFMTVGCGFAKEEFSWNTNLPIACAPEYIWDHIQCNKMYDEITREQGIQAIKMLQDWALYVNLITKKDIQRMAKI